jgi:large subunit ribosomal protein L17
MRHRKKGVILGREKAPREAMLKNMVQSVILYEHINTTLAKAKAVRPLVEKLITTGRTKTLTSRRALSRILSIESAVNKVLEELGPRYATRHGGYTRIIKLGRRKGDGSEIAQLQLVKD